MRPSHTYASLMIAAGVNAKALSVFMGHANISITMDRYGHLMPGSEEESAGLLDAYLNAQLDGAAERAVTRLANRVANEWRTRPRNRLGMRVSPCPPQTYHI